MPEHTYEEFVVDVVECLHHLSARVVWPYEGAKTDFENRLKEIAAKHAPAPVEAEPAEGSELVGDTPG